MIDLDQPWFGLMVDENVETKDLKAQAALDILWFGRPIGVG